MSAKKRNQYSLKQKEEIGKLALKYKQEYEEKIKEQKSLPKVWDSRRKKMISRVSTQTGGGFLAKAAREVFPELKEVKHDHPELQNAVKLAKRALEILEKKTTEDDDDSQPSSSKKRCREEGGGRKKKVPGVRLALFDWFIDVRGSLKGRLPIKLFRAKAIALHEEWLKTQDEQTKEKSDITFSRHWIRDWCTEYKVSLLKPNKRFQLKQADRKERIIELIKNIIRVRYHFNYFFQKEPTIINGDQMPLHRNESACEKTLSFKNQQVLLKKITN